MWHIYTFNLCIFCLNFLNKKRLKNSYAKKWAILLTILFSKHRLQIEWEVGDWALLFNFKSVLFLCPTVCLTNKDRHLSTITAPKPKPTFHLVFIWEIIQTLEEKLDLWWDSWFLVDYELKISFSVTINCGKFFKRWAYQTTWPASWETCMQVRNQQLELGMEQQTGSK